MDTAKPAHSCDIPDGRTHSERFRRKLLGAADNPGSDRMLKRLTVGQSLLFLFNTKEQVRGKRQLQNA